MVPRALTIASSDSGGGAGIQADLKAFAAAGCHGMSAIVALTAQNTTGVTAIYELPPEFVTAQLDALFDDIGVDAAKTGMLFSARLIETVADFLEQHHVPLVVDPVMVASSGAKLLEDDAVETLVTRLFPLATVVTPNLLEAETNKAFIAAAQRLVVVADHAKWNTVGLASIAALSVADTVISDAGFSPAARDVLNAHVRNLVLSARRPPVTNGEPTAWPP